ncbi:hypothetical protein BGW38_005256 [Lunasporangiospora selenospora]|uniref:Uncharacterized protein n=1 Tax=Lunasporangiospora selenospora TaxID=979761 RepID=A0A9P6FZM7_9FUNG|nr:hypothetical protein BGW38_005256 [Lunasporangiospora selenospora]
MVACMTAASAPSHGIKPQQPGATKQAMQMQELSDEAIKALLSKTRRHKKNRSAGKHSGTSPLLRQVLRRSLLGHIGKHQLKAEKC